MSYSLLLAGIIVGGLLTLLCLVFAIISLVKGRTTAIIIWAAGFLLAAGVLIFSAVRSLHMLVLESKSRFNEGMELSSEIHRKGLEVERQHWLDTLKAATSDRYATQVPEDFYENTAPKRLADGRMELPFVYPFRIRYNPETFTGDVFMDSSDSVFVKNVSAMAFDENFALMKIDNSASPEALKDGHTETEFILFDLRTRNYEAAPDKENLTDLARRIGYNGSYVLQSVSYDYIGWTSDKESD